MMRENVLGWRLKRIHTGPPAGSGALDLMYYSCYETVRKHLLSTPSESVETSLKNVAQPFIGSVDAGLCIIVVSEESSLALHTIIRDCHEIIPTVWN